MCGIVGYTGSQPALPALLDGLATLEYRGYDSAGVAVIGDSGSLQVVRRAGKLANLRAAFVAGDAPSGLTGIGHTRWATHGAPTDTNAHPHVDSCGRVAVVHNGIIENHLALRAELEASGRRFASETDSEVIAQLVGAELDARGSDGPEALEAAVRAALGRLVGTFALGVVDRFHPDRIVAARRAAPLLIGRAQGATLLGSDPAALVSHTRDLEALEDDQVAILTPAGARITNRSGDTAGGRQVSVDWAVDSIEKGEYPHFMLKEIHEQPAAVRATLTDRLGPDGGVRLDVEPASLPRISRVVLVSCGTSAYASMVGRAAIEYWARVPAEVEIASEFRYREPLLNPETLVVAVSQSGETADTIAAAEYARSQGAPVIAVTNVVGSSVVREADGVLYTRAGPEIGVAATKTFTTQVVVLNLLALWLAQRRGTHGARHCGEQVRAMQVLPQLVQEALELAPQVAEAVEQFVDAGYVMFIGRGTGVPVALEGALKLKEISYLHAEGYPAGEMKHGPIALIEAGGPVVAVASDPSVRDKVVANIAEVRARGAVVLALGTENDVDLKEHADRVWFVPPTPQLWSPVVDIVPLQLFGYHLAVALGRDVDQPRNLAKTVTVE